ncbi:hypothetical protein BJV77DRAFT_963198 [Russula vinacea]|nr:hypothetical protein BJV77DRAFT_963198 [Russula vinacea]
MEGPHNLHGFPELTGPLREHESKFGSCPELRQRERECEARRDHRRRWPVGPRTGCTTQVSGIKTLVVEREARIGDLWRKRFPPTWPVFAPAPKAGCGLAGELCPLSGIGRVDILHRHAGYAGPLTKKWTVEIERANAEPRLFVVNHLVFALGFAGGTYKVPEIPGAHLHSFHYKKAKDYEGKKVVVVGACTSGHDIAKDLHDNGVDVTMFQRSSTHVMSIKHGVSRVFGSSLISFHKMSVATENLLEQVFIPKGPSPDVADRINASFSIYLQKPLHQRIVVDIANDDRETLDGLHVGASQLIIDGKIKLKNDAQIANFTEKGLEFADGSTLYADAVVFATGLGEARDPMRKILGPEAGARLKQIWGLTLRAR